MSVAQGKRSAALGSEAIMKIPSLHGLPCRPVGSARQTVKRGLRRGVGYPGRQSLRAFALGYYLVAPTGRQTDVGRNRNVVNSSNLDFTARMLKPAGVSLTLLVVDLPYELLSPPQGGCP